MIIEWLIILSVPSNHHNSHLLVIHRARNYTKKMKTKNILWCQSCKLTKNKKWIKIDDKDEMKNWTWQLKVRWHHKEMLDWYKRGRCLDSSHSFSNTKLSNLADTSPFSHSLPQEVHRQESFINSASFFWLWPTETFKIFILSYQVQQTRTYGPQKSLQIFS